jgi:uncharacterized membrane protein YdjX (TVP38/TMEM64 family)
MSAKTAGNNSVARGIIVLGAMLALVVLGRVLPVAAWFESLNAWVRGQGWWAPFVFGAVYVAATVLFLPGSVLTLAAGAIFGVVRGTIIVSIASTTGAALSFLIARYVLREWVTRRLATNARFTAIDHAIGREGAKIVLLLRLSPVVPFNALNYLLGLTAVRFLTATLASWIGMLPATVVFVYLGSAGRAGLAAASGASGETDWLKLFVYGAGFVATLAVSVIVARIARRALRDVGADAPVTAEVEPPR